MNHQMEHRVIPKVSLLPSRCIRRATGTTSDPQVDSHESQPAQKSFAQRVARGGASAVEMAIVLPLLLLMIFGIIEFGRAIMVHQVLVNSAREATRRAVVPGATDAQVLANVTKYMTSAGITGYTVALEIDGTSAALNNASTSITNATSKSSIAIEVSVPNSQVGWGILDLIAPNRSFAAGVQMRKE